MNGTLRCSILDNILQKTLDKSHNTIRVRCSRALTP